MLSPVLGLPALLAKMEHIGDAMVPRLPLRHRYLPRVKHR